MIRHRRASATGCSLSYVAPSRRRFLALALAATITGALLLAPAALGAKKYLPVAKFPRYSYEEEGWTPTSFNRLYAESVAASDNNGHIYIADSGRGAVYDYESITDKTPERWNGTNTPAGSFGGSFLSVAVDNTSGDVFVADRTHAVIDKFDESGNLIESFGDTTPSLNGQLAGIETPAGSFSPPTEYYTSFPIAVNQVNHDLYVVDPGHEVIDIFDENGSYLKQISATEPNMYRGATTGLAVDGTNGNVYMTDQMSPNLLFEFDAAGNYVSTWNGSSTPSGYFSPPVSYGGVCCLLSVATEESSGHVLVGAYANYAVDSFDENGTFLPPELNRSEFPGEYRLGYVSGVAIDQATGYLYVSVGSQVEVFQPLIVPDVTVNPASEVSGTTASLSGHVDPAGGGDVTGCHFDYISDAKFRENTKENGLADPWAGETEAPCQTTPPSTPPYSSATDVHAGATGLVPGAIYHLRLVAANSEGINRATAPTFATEGEYLFATALGSSGSGDGQLEEPQDVAVDGTNGDVYVADTGNHRVVKFDGSGNFVSAWGWGVGDGASAAEVCTSGCQAGIAGTEPGQFETPRYIEVDNSSGPSAHDVYVADTADGVVQKFTPNGDLITSWGEGGAIDFSKNGAIEGMTVSQIGDLFVVGDHEGYPWTQVGQDGVSRSELETGSFFGLGAPSGGGIEIDAFGGYYETQPEGGVNYRNPQGQAYSGHSVYPSWYGRLASSGLALNRATGDIYVDQGEHIDQFLVSASCVSGPGGGIIGGSSCGPNDSFGFGDLTNGSGLAFNETNGRVYAADAGGNRVAAFDPQPAPAVTTGPASSVAATSATLTGHVEPAASESVTTCRFEYGTDTTYQLGNVPCSPGGPLASGSDVSAELSGLTPLTTYHYRLVASGENGIVRRGRDRSFTPATGTPPLIVETASSEVGPTGATLNAQINPEMAPTIYRFQYGTTPSYGSQTAMSESIGEDEAAHLVSYALSELQPGSTYHFRVVAVNFNGTTVGPDRTFNTPEAPSVTQTGVSVVTQTTATLNAGVTAGFSPTTFSFEYGPTTGYGHSVGGKLGADNVLHNVSRPVTGLSPGTTYHVRVVATNGFGEAVGDDVTFTTPSSESAPPPPPRCRRGFVRRHGKCVKRPRKRHRKHRRHRASHSKRSNGHG